MLIGIGPDIGGPLGPYRQVSVLLQIINSLADQDVVAKNCYIPNAC